jgi:hypothetical protein
MLHFIYDRCPLHKKFGWSILSNRKQALIVQWGTTQPTSKRSKEQHNTKITSTQPYFHHKERKQDISTTRLPLAETAEREAKLVRQTAANDDSEKIESS